MPSIPAVMSIAMIKRQITNPTFLAAMPVVKFSYGAPMNMIAEEAGEISVKAPPL